jgi:hypothetical protein
MRWPKIWGQVRERWGWLGIAIAFCVCVFLKLNGSSVGIWTELLNDPKPPPGLLLSIPKGVRADEWHGWTPAALSQSQQTPRFPVENLTLGGGRAPLLMSVPVAYYTTLFRPQLWGFFLFDFERGFSFYWCLKIFGLLIASGWFLREIGIRDRNIVLLGTLWIFFSGYVQWWFSSPAMLPEMIATWAVCTGCAIRFFKETGTWKTITIFAAFVFCGVNFVLCLYPPYQVPLLLLMLAVVAGAYFTRRSEDRFNWLRACILIGAGVSIVVVLLTPFWIDVRSTLDLVAHTDYPGSRRSLGGGLSLFQLFSGLVGFFQTEDTVPAAFDNVAEASNFYPLWPAVVYTVLFSRWRKIGPVSPLIIAMAVFVVSLSLYCLVPFPRWLLQITLLEFAPERRAILAIGLANIFLCCLFLDAYKRRIFSKWNFVLVTLFFFFGLAALLWTSGLRVPRFFPDWRQLAAAVAIDFVILILFFSRLDRRWFLLALVFFLAVSNAGVNPVMRGLAPLLKSEAFQAMEEARRKDPDGKWIVFHDFNLAQMVVATGAPVLNGNKIVPDFGFWHQLDPDGVGAPVYNRYANIECELAETSLAASARLFHHDSFILSLPPELPVLREIGCRYFVFPAVWPSAEQHGFIQVYANQRSGIFVYKRL